SRFVNESEPSENIGVWWPARPIEKLVIVRTTASYSDISILNVDKSARIESRITPPVPNLLPTTPKSQETSLQYVSQPQVVIRLPDGGDTAARHTRPDDPRFPKFQAFRSSQSPSRKTSESRRRPIDPWVPHRSRAGAST